MGFLRQLLRQDNMEVGSFALAIGVGGYLFTKNAYAANKYVRFAGKKNENGELVPVETILKFRFESILQKFDFSEWNKSYIRVYINKYLDPNVVGGVNLKNGIRIGVPDYYQRLSDEGIKNSVTIGNESIDWDCPAGQRLLEALKLGEYEQKYIIACNVALGEGYYTTYDSLIPPFVIYSAYSVGSRIYKWLKLHQKPLFLTFVVYAVHLTFFTLLCVGLRDALYTIYYHAAEDRVCDFGTSYVNGGTEYYKKKIERNKALRELLKYGPKYYTEDGNELGLWRVKGFLDTFKLMAAKARSAQYEILEEHKKVPTPNPNPHPII